VDLLIRGFRFDPLGAHHTRRAPPATPAGRSTGPASCRANRGTRLPHPDRSPADDAAASRPPTTAAGSAARPSDRSSSTTAGGASRRSAGRAATAHRPPHRRARPPTSRSPGTHRSGTRSRASSASGQAGPSPRLLVVAHRDQPSLPLLRRESPREPGRRAVDPSDLAHWAGGMDPRTNSEARRCGRGPT
jgi:hypothetical protein